MTVTATQINTALQAASDAGGGTVLLPPGTITIDAPIGNTTAALSNVRLIGAGFRGVMGTGGGGTVLKCSGNFPAIAGIWQNSEISNLGLNANLQGSPAILAHFSKTIIDRVEAVGWMGYGFNLNDGTYSVDTGYLNRIINSCITDSGSETGTALLVGFRFTDSWIVRNNIEAPDTDILVDSGGPLRILDNHLDGNRHPTRNIIMRGTASNILIRGNICEAYTAESIVWYADNWHTAPQYAAINITGNIIRSQYTDGTHPIIALRGDTMDWGGTPSAGYRANGFTISGNTFNALGGSTPATYAVQAAEVDHVAVTGNAWPAAYATGPVLASTDCVGVEAVCNGGQNTITTV